MSSIDLQPIDVFSRRLMPRVAAQLPVDLYCLGLPGALSLRTTDIGVGGLCVESSFPFSLDSLRRIVINLPGGTIQAKVEGRWQRNAPGSGGLLTGLQLQDPTPEENRLLSEFVHERAGELASFLRERSEVGPALQHEALDLALLTRIVELPTGTWLYRQDTLGERGGSLFVLYDGRVVLETCAPNRRPVLVDQLEVGRVFGRTHLPGSVPYLESAYIESSALLLEIDSFTFNYFARTRSIAAQQIAEIQTARLAQNFAAIASKVGGLETSPQTPAGGADASHAASSHLS